MIRGQRLLVLLDIFLISFGVYLGITVYDRITSAQIDPMLFNPTSRPVVSERRNPTYRPLSYYQPIINRNLFNTQTVSIKKPEPLNPDILPSTGLDLKLWGTVTGKDDVLYAVIQDTSWIGRKRKQKLYKPGDIIQNAVLTRVYRDKVVLKVDGKSETLKLETIHRKPAIRRKSFRLNRVIRRTAIEKAVRAAKRLPVESQFRRHPEGLYLTHINRNPIFRRMGLRNGDIITAVNGQHIYSVKEVWAIYDLIQSQPRFKLEIKRRGRPGTIKYIVK